MTVYRTNCGCIQSYPEPSVCEYETYEAYYAAMDAWAQEWKEMAQAHEERCPMSAYYRPGVE